MHDYLSDEDLEMSEDAFRKLLNTSYFPSITAETSEDQMRSILSKGSTEWEDNLREAFEMFEYQGYDPKVIMAQLLKSCGEDAAKKKQLSNDIMNMSALVALRGTNFSKIQAHATDMLQEAMNTWQSRYNLKIKRPGSGYKKTDINLSRVANLIPLYAAITAKITMKCAVDDDKIPDVPYSMRCTQFSGCIPTDMTYTNQLKDLHLKYLVELDKVIHSKDKKYTPLTDIMKYQEAAIASTYSSSTVRVEWLKKLGILKKNTNEINLSKDGQFVDPFEKLNVTLPKDTATTAKDGSKSAGD